MLEDSVRQVDGFARVEEALEKIVGARVIVLTSPFRRCVATAIKLARDLKLDPPIVDNALLNFQKGLKPTASLATQFLTERS